MPVGVNNRFLLLYGSQTGQAQAIAEEIAEKADSFNLHADIHCFSQTEKKFFIEREKCVVIITSTTGDGEPPDTALKFFRRIRKKTIPDDYLSQLSYALLGLGDSNYTNFCNCGKTLDKRLQELGAKPFYPQGWADDAVGLELAAEPWIDNLFPAVKHFLGHSGSDNTKISEVISTSVTNTQTNNNMEVKSHINGEGSNSGGGKSPEEQGKCDSSNIAKDVGSGEPGTVVSDRIINDVTDTHEGTSKSTAPNNSNNSNKSVEHNLNNSNVNGNSMTPDLSRPNSDIITKQSEQTMIEVKKDSNISNVNPNTDKSTHDINSLAASFQAGISLSGEITGGNDGLSIKKSLPPLSESALSVPILPPPYLKIEFPADVKLDVNNLPLQNGASLPSSSSPVFMAKVVSAVTMTTQTAVKKAMHVTLDISGSCFKYQPGDSFSLICPNSEKEVKTLLERLGLRGKADSIYRLTILTDSKKKHASVPSHIHETGTLQRTLMTCVDLREPPKKALIRSLVEYTDNTTEKRRLQELCSKQGASDYTSYIREPAVSILDILSQFPSCKPPIERILEHSPRLQPRPYSVCSSQLTAPNSVSFVFNVINVPYGSGRSYERKGVATGWLEFIQTLQNLMDRMNIANEIQVPIFTRTNQTFHLPEDVTTPIVLIGPGTGVAPFVGFLDHLAEQRQTGNQDSWGEVWLFFGCRHKTRDYLFRDKLETHLSNKTLTKLLISFSRDSDQPEGTPRYVQDNIRSHGPELVNLVEEKKAIVYVCGDAKNMAKDVNQAFIDVMAKEKGITADEGRKYMMKLRLEKKYREDVWT